jgi:hypothetical protein
LCVYFDYKVITKIFFYLEKTETALTAMKNQKKPNKKKFKLNKSENENKND